jgi:hypothetical protein
MDLTARQVAEMEDSNYATLAAIARVTPGMSLIQRDDVIIICNPAFPIPDTTHACRLRTTPQNAEGLIAEVAEYFTSQDLPATIILSPACTPADLPGRLLERGFVRQEAEDAWLILDNVPGVPIPPAIPSAQVRSVGSDEAATYAAVYLTAFEMPLEFAPYMAERMQPVMSLPGFYHYIAFIDGQPAGVCSLYCNGSFGILGSTGVIPAYRRGGAATNLGISAVADAQKQGVQTLVVQTTGGTLFERFILMSGFKKAFTRICYSLP